MVVHRSSLVFIGRTTFVLVTMEMCLVRQYDSFETLI